ncbi:MAG: helix-turn-helix domain-containing protein [Clostridiales bacterium]|nr:helix-turn-helix domain-containing protein [Clostridiales bacterium]
MNEDLLRRLSALTEEEERLLGGAPLDKQAYSTDPSFLVQSAKMIPQGQAITLRPHTRFTPFPLHRHDFVEILYMLKGKTLHTMEDGAHITLQAGEILMMNCHTAHAIATCGREDVAVNLIVQPSFFDFALETIGSGSTLGRFLIDALRAGEKEVPYLYFKVAEVQPIQSLMESLLFSLLDKPNGGQLLHKTAMTLLFLHLTSNAERMTLSTLHKGNALAVKLLREIHRNYQTLCLSDFAKAHGVSPAYLSKAARTATGKSCTELLQARRLKKAKDLLENTNLSVLEICAAVGYSNSSYFYRLFEKEEGVSPTAYRRSFQVKSGRR